LTWIKAGDGVSGAGLALTTTAPRNTGISVTHPSETFATGRTEFLAGHDQLKPFLMAVAIFLVAGVVALLFTGLPQS
jgi:hypothetical protein